MGLAVLAANGLTPAVLSLQPDAAHPAPLYRLLGCRWLQDSFDLLLLASAMREEGYLPPSLSLWAVENPMLAPVHRLAQKVDAGAEVVLTQPPLLWDRAARWAEQAAAARVSDNVKVRRWRWRWYGNQGQAVSMPHTGQQMIASAAAPQVLVVPLPCLHPPQLVLGMPIISSAGNLDFWLRLCGARGLPEAAALLASFPQAGDGSGGKAAHAAAVHDWNASLIQRVRVDGWHQAPA